VYFLVKWNSLYLFSSYFSMEHYRHHLVSLQYVLSGNTLPLHHDRRWHQHPAYILCLSCLQRNWWCRLNVFKSQSHFDKSLKSNHAGCCVELYAIIRARLLAVASLGLVSSGATTQGVTPIFSWNNWPPFFARHYHFIAFTRVSPP